MVFACTCVCSEVAIAVDQFVQKYAECKSDGATTRLAKDARQCQLGLVRVACQISVETVEDEQLNQLEKLLTYTWSES